MPKLPTGGSKSPNNQSSGRPAPPRGGKAGVNKGTGPGSTTATVTTNVVNQQQSGVNNNTPVEQASGQGTQYSTRQQNRQERRDRRQTRRENRQDNNGGGGGGGGTTFGGGGFDTSSYHGTYYGRSGATQRLRDYGSTVSNGGRTTGLDGSPVDIYHNNDSGGVEGEAAGGGGGAAGGGGGTGANAAIQGVAPLVSGQSVEEFVRYGAKKTRKTGGKKTL